MSLHATELEAFRRRRARIGWVRLWVLGVLHQASRAAGRLLDLYGKKAAGTWGA